MANRRAHRLSDSQLPMPTLGASSFATSSSVGRGYDATAEGELSHPIGTLRNVEPEPLSPSFSQWARNLANACRALGLVAPSFRSPPADPAADRTLQRRAGDEGVTVFVRLWPRRLPAIRDDMIEGVLAANGATGARADELRSMLEDVAPLPELARHG